jgi:hypothetical protein
MNYLTFEICFDLDVTGTKRVNMLIKGETRKDIIVNFSRRNICLFRFLLTLHLLLRNMILGYIGFFLAVAVTMS